MQKPVLVVMAAGMGSRYGGLKQLDPVGPTEQTILQYSLFDASRAGFERVVFIIRPELEEAFEAAIGQRVRVGMQVKYAYQTLDTLPEGLCVPNGREKPLGTAHAVYCAKDAVDGAPFAVINADDFYGADAFETIYRFLLDAKDDASTYHYCMVGYPIENTLTDNGTVSRGVCSVDENCFLTDIVERTAISRGDNGKIYDKENGASHSIAQGSLVSMNLWGFTPSFFTTLCAGLQHFFKTEIVKNPQKAEYYLPFAVDALIKAGKATAKVLGTSAQWFGITYQEDRPIVCQKIAKMTQDGIYPNNF